MRRSGLGQFVLLSVMAGAAFGQAPAAPSYLAVEQTIGNIRGEWAKPGAATQPNAPGWNALFDALLGDLRNYAVATTQGDRLASMNRVYQISVGLNSVSWAPAARVRESLREWLRPRVRLAWAERRLVERVHTMPPASNPGVQGNREQWVRFVDNELGLALRKYDGATTVAQRQDALKAVNHALTALQTRNQVSPWSPAMDLQTALNDLYNLPNFDVSVDVYTLSPAININLVTSGPVTRKGYVSQVTAGPKTGFGLLPSNDGILFYNSQSLSTYTPITDFQQQVQRDQQGKRAAKMYQFNASSSDSAELTIYTAIRSTGLQIWPAYRHNVGANISTTPQERAKLARAIAGLVGYNQPRITQLAWQNAIGQIQSNVEKEALEEGYERTAREAATRNAELSRYLIGGDRVAFQNILIEGLSLRSRPENALIGGKIEFMNAKNQFGADAPQPPALAVPDSGVSADVHISSVMANFARGFLDSPAARLVGNLMVETQKVAADAPPGQGAKVTRNADYAAFLKAIEAAQAANDPKVIAVRVKRPDTPPDFGADAKGNLVAIVHDFQLEVPAPPTAARGGAAGPPARVYRISSPAAEFVISFKVEAQPAGAPLRLTGRIEDMNPGLNAKVYAINEDENQPTALPAFPATIVLGVFRSKLRGQPIDVPLNNAQLRGFAIRSVSPLDPSGWIRVNLVRTSFSPAAGVQAPPGVAPINPTPTAPAVGPSTSAVVTPAAVPR